MPLGLRNSPTQFQRLMNTVLSDLVGQCCAIFLDDMIIWQEHLLHPQSVFARLSEANLKAHSAKCTLGTSELLYLGHKIDEPGNRPDLAKC